MAHFLLDALDLPLRLQVLPDAAMINAEEEEAEEEEVEEEPQPVRARTQRSSKRVSHSWLLTPSSHCLCYKIQISTRWSSTSHFIASHGRRTLAVTDSFILKGD